MCRILILADINLWGISIHAVVVFALGKNLLFNSVLGHCALSIQLWMFNSWFSNSNFLSTQTQHQLYLFSCGKGEDERFKASSFSSKVNGASITCIKRMEKFPLYYFINASYSYIRVIHTYEYIHITLAYKVHTCMLLQLPDENAQPCLRCCKFVNRT